LSGIRTHDPSVRADEDSSYLRPRGHCDRHSVAWCCVFHNLISAAVSQTSSSCRKTYTVVPLVTSHFTKLTRTRNNLQTYRYYTNNGLEPSSGHVGFVVDKVALGQVFSEYFGFSSQFAFHRLLHTHHLSSVAGIIGQLMADVTSGLSLTPPQETKKKTTI
jgi:hypothetical protein